MTFSHALSTNNYGPAKFIVDANAANGTHTTLTLALLSASSGDTIFIRPGTYTENLTLKAGVNLTAYMCDSLTPNVTIVGTCTFTAAGTVAISGIRLQTNSAALLAVTGTLASIVKVKGCYLNCTNNTGISFTTSSASARIDFYECEGDLGTTGIAYFASTSAGSITFANCQFGNSGASVTASTISAGAIALLYNNFGNPITTSSTAGFNSSFNTFSSFGNTTGLTIGGSGGSASTSDSVSSGSATCITCTSTLTLTKSTLSTSNAVVAGGAGTITFSDASIPGGTGLVAPTTLTPVYLQYGIGRSTTQPAFLAYLAASALNKTGNNTTYTLGTDALTEVFDQNGNFNTNGTFTAPLTGKYTLLGSTLIVGCTIASILTTSIVTSNRSYIFQLSRTAGAQNLGMGFQALTDMDAADTATFTVQTNGEGADTDDVFGSSTIGTFVSGNLTC